MLFQANCILFSALNLRIFFTLLGHFPCLFNSSLNTKYSWYLAVPLMQGNSGSSQTEEVVETKSKVAIKAKVAKRMMTFMLAFQFPTER